MFSKRFPSVATSALIAFSVAALARAEAPFDDAPPRPPYGALSSVTANRSPASPPETAKVVAPSAEKVEGYAFVGFDQLAGFPFEPPPIQSADDASKSPAPDVMHQVPAAIKKLDGQKVIVMGFMLPVKMEKGLATEFLLLNSPLMCCFGVTPATNALVIVKMPKGVPAVQDVPLRFSGRLQVRAQWDNGWLASIYQLDGDETVMPRR